MGKQRWKAGNMLYPVPAVMVSCKGKDTKANIITLAWAGTVCSDPVMLSVSIRPERYSHDIIEKSGEFAREIYELGLRLSDKNPVKGLGLYEKKLLLKKLCHLEECYKNLVEI